MENRTTNNLYLVEIKDLHNGGNLGVVWQMSSVEIETFNRDNASAGLQAVAIIK